MFSEGLPVYSDDIMQFDALLMAKTMFSRWLYWSSPGNQWWWRNRMISARFKGVRQAMITKFWSHSIPLSSIHPSLTLCPLTPQGSYEFSWTAVKPLYWFNRHPLSRISLSPAKILQSWLIFHNPQPVPDPSPAIHLHGKDSGNIDLFFSLSLVDPSPWTLNPATRKGSPRVL